MCLRGGGNSGTERERKGECISILFYYFLHFTYCTYFTYLCVCECLVTTKKTLTEKLRERNRKKEERNEKRCRKKGAWILGLLRLVGLLGLLRLLWYTIYDYHACV